MSRGRVRFSKAAAAAALALITWLATPPTATAQQGVTTGAIQGRVVDNTGSPLAEATVSVREVETGREREVRTNTDGRYVAGLLPPGSYVVRAQFPPLEAVERGPIAVSLGVTRTVDIALQPVEVAGITVRLEGDVDVAQGGVVELVDEEQIEALPTLGRDFTDFINLSGLVSPTPEVTTGGQFSLGGGRTSATNVQIDGVDANNAFFGENRGSSRIPFTFSLESIREFQIITNGFDVEHGNYTGGVINAVTKGGTNEVEGTAFYYRRDEALTADGFDGEPPTDFQTHQFGLRLGGPIARDKAHFFVSLDGQRKDEPIFAIVPGVWAGHPDSLARFIEILRDVYGIPQSEIDANIGTFEETEDELAIFGRVDWQISNRHALTLRHNFVNFDQENDRVSTEEARTHGGGFEDTANSFVSELTSVLGDEGYNTFRFQWSYEDRPRPGNDHLPEVDVRIDSNAPAVEYFGDGIVFRNRLEETKLQVVDNLTWRLGETGRHTVKLGTNNVFTTIENLFWLNGNGEYRFSNLAAFANRQPSQFTRNLREDAQPPLANFDISEYSVYAQDEIQATDQLLVALGLRYDTNVFNDPAEAPRDTFRVPLEELFGLDPTVVPEDRNNVSPRLAFTYDIRGDETAVVRGGAGLLYGRMPMVLHGNVMQTVPPLLFLSCTGAAIPVPDYDFFRQAPDGSNNPTQCATGAAAGGRPEFSIWDEDFENPEAWKLNLGYEQVMAGGPLESWRFSGDVLYSRTEKNFNVINANQRAEQFRTAPDDRPVFVATNQFAPFSVSSSNRISSPIFQNLYVNESTAESEAWSLTFKTAREWEALRFDGSYTFNHVFDNSSFFCCTSNEGFRSKPTAGDPNFIGDPGDEDEGTWGPADFERRHVVILSGTWQAPWGIDVSGIWRSQSGTPYTLLVTGDVNGDGETGNDRAPVFAEGLQFGRVVSGAVVAGSPAEEEAEWLALLEGGGSEAGECLREELGRIARRNTCRNPWFHSVDLHVSKAFPTIRGQEVEIIADLFNVLNGLNEDWGKFVFVSGNEPLNKEGYDATTNKVIYSVRGDFGDELATGFNPLQFQAQLGVRYRF